MTSNSTIRLHLENRNWLATFSGPEAAEVIALFGTDTIPTAYRMPTSADTVRQAIQALNPGSIVTVDTATH